MRKIVILLNGAALAGSIVGIAAAQEAPDLRRQLAACALFKGELERLECFDGLTTRSGLAGPQVQPSPVDGVGKWQVHRDVNPIDDSERVTLVLSADTGQSTRGEVILLVARCQSNETEVYIDWNDYLGDDSLDVYEKWKNVTIRIGNNKSLRQRWGVSTDSSATFAPSWAGDLLKQMATAHTFLAQVTPYSESPVTAIFDTRGLALALEPLAQACGWRMGQPSRAPAAVHGAAPAPEDDFSDLLRAVQRLDAAGN